MNKSQFNKYVRESLTKRHRNSKIEDANELIDIFVESVINAIAENDEILLVGFGRFSKTHVETRMGRNPQTGAPIKIKSYNQVKFKPGIKLKESCNKTKKPKK
jgi:DNA-binding protein HU-alpha